MPGRLSLVDLTEEELAIVQKESMAKMAGISVKEMSQGEDEQGKARLTRANLDELSQNPLVLPRIRSAKSRKGFLSERSASKKVSP